MLETFKSMFLYTVDIFAVRVSFIIAFIARVITRRNLMVFSDTINWNADCNS